MFLLTLLAAFTAIDATAITQLRKVEYVPSSSQHDGHSLDPQYLIGEVIASEFDRHVPVLSDNIRGELNTLRNDINRQFDSLKHHMDVKLDRMQRDAPNSGDEAREDVRQRQDRPVAATPAATIRHNLAMAELRRLAAELTRAMNEEVAKLRDEFRSSLDHLREQVHNSTDNLASRLGDEFSSQAEESTTMLKKVFFLTRNQMKLIQSQLTNISSAILVNVPQPTTTPTSDTEVTDEQQTPEVTTVTESDTTITTSPPEDSVPDTTTAAPDIPSTHIPTTTESQVIPRDCMEAREHGRNSSGVFKIRPYSEITYKKVWCDQETDGGGWTVMLWRKKQAEQIDFRRSWGAYAEGFGAPDGEYWIGLETLYHLTKEKPYQLRVDMTWEDEHAFSLYNVFRVGPERFKYELNVGGYQSSSTGGDAMEYHSGMEFSTFGNDNDMATGGSCSEWSGGGGWWYNFCYYSNPTGIYPPSDLPPNVQADHFVEWRKWQGYYTYLSDLRMMIRPN